MTRPAGVIQRTNRGENALLFCPPTPCHVTFYSTTGTRCDHGLSVSSITCRTIRTGRIAEALTRGKRDKGTLGESRGRKANGATVTLILGAATPAGSPNGIPLQKWV